MSKTAANRRLNRRAAIVLGIGLLVVVPGFLAFKAYRERHHGALYLREARKYLEKSQTALALQYLNRYLALKPDDVDALDLKAKVLAEGARNGYQALEAMPIHNQVLGRDPENPKRQETRRRLVELNLKVGGRARAAEDLARELVRRGAHDAGAHRLLAAALEQIGAEGDTKALEEASREYEAAERIEPGDVDGAERLARLYRDRLGKPEKAVEVLDHLVALNRGTPRKLAAAHLARSRYFLGARDPGRADLEIAAALKADPSSVDVRLAAAEAAGRRGRPEEARRQLDAIPKAERGELRIKLVEGLVDLRENRPDEAVRSWRAGLLQTGGSNADLTWYLAQVLLELGRTSEADPLIAQYRRLVGGDEPNPNYRYLHGFSLLRKDRPAEAIAELEAIRYKAPKPLEPDVAYLLGQCYERANDAPKAIDAYRQAARSSPQWGPPWVAIANLQGAAHLDDAARTLEQGLAMNPDDPRMLINSALILLRKQLQLPRERRSWAEVERTLERAAKVAPGAAELALVQADYLNAVGKPEEALAKLKAASEAHPTVAPLRLARANLLGRLGRAGEALEVLDRAAGSATEAGAFVLRAALLLGQGHVKQARASLVDALGKVPADQRPWIWKALGEFSLGQSDPVEARHAFEEWAKLRPDLPEPRAALLSLAMKSGDEAAVRADVEAMKGIGGPDSPYWRMARVEELLRDRRPAGAALDEASRLVRELEASQPGLAAGFLLEARIWEKRGAVDKAIAAYEKALGKTAGREALAPLTTLLVREHRDAELERIRKDLASLPPEIERLATVQALKLGDKGLAEGLAAGMVREAPGRLDARVWQARVLNELGKPEEAEGVLRQLVAQHPDDPAPWVQLLTFQVSRKQKEQARATVEEIRTRVKTDRPEFLWAQCYRMLGDRERADACYREAITRWPDDLSVRTGAIAYYEQTGRKAEAEESLRQVLRIDPALGWASRKLALSLASHEGDRAARDEALRLIGTTPRADDLPEDRLVRAEVLARGTDPGDRQQAIVILEELASELPGAANIQERLARLLLAAGQVDRAREHAARASAGEGATPDAILLYAGTLLGSKTLDEAERQLGRLAAIEPNNLAVAELEARILDAKGKGREGAEVLERVFLAKVDTPEGLSIGEKMIGLLLRLGQPEVAERVARRAGTLGPRGGALFGQFLAGRGRLDEASRQLEAAAKGGDPATAGSTALALASLPDADPRWLALADRFLAEALARRPGAADLLEKQARVRYLQRRYDDQMAIYRAILDGKPGDFTFLNDMAWTLSEEMGRPEDGLRRAEEAYAHIGPQANLLDTRGAILTRLGKLDEAIKDLEAAASGLPIGPVYFHLARAYQKKGRVEDYRKARDLARQARLRPEELQPSERAEWQTVMGR